MTHLIKKNISVEILEEASWAKANNGNYVVQCNPNTKILGSLPTYNGSQHGAMLNVPGNNAVQVDTHDAFRGDSISVKPGDVFVKTLSSNNTHVRTTDWPQFGNQSRSRISEAMAVAFVDYKPVEGQLFPPPIGRDTNPIINFLRSKPITKDILKFDKLKSIYDLSKVTNLPGWDTLEEVFSDFWLEGYDGWNTDTQTPALQHPGYGRDLASWVSKGLLYLNSTEPLEKKKKLATYMVDQGLALAGAFADGRVHQANGGHMQGRKALLVLAGYLLNIPQMSNPNWLGHIFQEDHMHRKDSDLWWFEDWDVFWRRASEYKHPCNEHPDGWTENQKWAFQGYYWHACGANIGTAMAMSAMGLSKGMGQDFIEGIRQYVVGPPDEAKEDVKNAGMTIPWGMDFPHPWNGPGMQKQLFDIYGI